VQIIKDNGYTNVTEIAGGMDEWTKSGYPVSSNISTDNLTVVTSPFTLIPGDISGTPLSHGSVIYHWANGVTEVVGPDKQPILIALDSEAAKSETSTGVKAVTWLYRVPTGTEARLGDTSGTTGFYLDGKLILTVVLKNESFAE